MADNRSAHEVYNSNTALLQKLASAVKGHAATATFTCGGSVPLSDLSTSNFGPDAQNFSRSVTLRWDSKDSYIEHSKIEFPLLHHDHFSRRALDSLLRHCQPATFGLDGRDVLDERYRKAAKLDTSEFSTNFHPHDCGILDSVQQILLPSTIRGGQGVGIGPQGVRAELYKLNVYSAPSGRFLSHVDTPRGVLQFGSLVVCLPWQHEGGTLRVKHRGETVDFAWGHNSQQSIQWAAFYGDCEHEVLEVIKGHRITLTYNLYYTSIGKLAQPVSTPDHLPLFDIARRMLLQPRFMRRGGILGFFCHHQYAHSQESGRKTVPGAFKGVDLAIFSVFHALGLKVGIHPIVYNRDARMGGLSSRELMEGPTVPREGDFVENCLEKLSKRSKLLRCSCYDAGISGYVDDSNEDEYPEDYETIVGTSFHGPTFSESYEEGGDKEPVTSAWPHKKVSRIVWMNEPVHSDFAHAGLAYGNEATLNYRFSFAAILVVVPPSEKRETMTPAGREINTADSHRVVVASAPSTAPPSTVAATPAPSESAGSAHSGNVLETVSYDTWGWALDGESLMPPVGKGFSGGF